MATQTMSSGSENDMCPICKSSRYLNPDMRFLVNPECYHKMCESCVDRIFAVGPAPCPYPRCGKILRKNKFKTQVFEDLGVEKEVDIRQRVQRTFNKRREEFDSLKEYNDYLEEVENITFNLVYSIDVEETEAKLQMYEQANRTQILANSLRQKQEDEVMEEIQAREMQRRRQLLQLTLDAEEEERTIKQQTERDLVRKLATAKDRDADSIIQEMRKSTQVALKKSSARRRELENTINQPIVIRPKGRPGAPNVEAVSTPFTPFAGDRQKHYNFAVNDSYFDPLMQDVASDPQVRGSGFMTQDAYRQALVTAFLGLGCDIQAEKATASA